MKKTLLYGFASLAALVLAGCSGDYDDWTSPQSYSADAATAKYGLTFTNGPEVNAVLPDADGLVHLVTVNTNDSAVSGYTIKTLTVNGESVSGQMVGNDICVDAATLEKLVVTQYDSRAALARPVEVKANVSINLSTGDAVTSDAVSDINGTVTPQPVPAIDANGYYLLGNFTENGTGWDLSAPIMMTDNGDGTYSANVTTTSDDSWYKFYCGSHYSDYDWDIVNQGQMGCETSDDNARHNFLVYTGDPLYTSGVQTPVIHGAGQWMVTLDMKNLTYTVAPAEAKYYVVGNINEGNGWSADNCFQNMFYAQGDNVYTYTTYWKGSWDLKFWKSTDVGMWGNAYGTAIDGDGSQSGTLVNSNSNSFQAPSAGYYTLTINMNDNTYYWTLVDNQSPTEYNNISLIGDFNGWGGDVDLTKLNNAPHNWYGRVTIPSDGGLKFRANHDWGTNWGTSDADKDTAIGDTYHLSSVPGGQNITVPAGTYDFYLNDITGDWSIAPVE